MLKLTTRVEVFGAQEFFAGSLGDFKSRGRTVALNLDQSERAAMNRLFALTQPAALSTFVELWETALHGRTRSSLVANHTHTTAPRTTDHDLANVIFN